MKIIKQLAVFVALITSVNLYANEKGNGGESQVGPKFYGILMAVDNALDGKYRLTDALQIPTPIQIEPTANRLYIEPGVEVDAISFKRGTERVTQINYKRWADAHNSWERLIVLIVHETLVQSGRESSTSYSLSTIITNEALSRINNIIVRLKDSGWVIVYDPRNIEISAFFGGTNINAKVNTAGNTVFLSIVAVNGFDAGIIARKDFPTNKFLCNLFGFKEGDGLGTKQATFNSLDPFELYSLDLSTGARLDPSRYSVQEMAKYELIKSVSCSL